MASKAAAKAAERVVAGIGDGAVLAKTGRDWRDWLSTLDTHDAAKRSHKEIVAILSSEYGLPGWWRQMVAVGYEQERGLRAKHEKVDGYSVSVSRTVGAPLSHCYKAFVDKRARAKWLSGYDATIRSSGAEKYCRMSLEENGPVAEIRFTPKGEAKTQVAVEVSKLPGARDVETLRELWSGILDRLKASL